jgi:hypothetical protein
MTEDEAKTKWCPFARVSLAGTKLQISPHNRAEADHGSRVDSVPNPPYARCLGSACMAWRWAQEPLPAVVDDAVEGRGYCGLAGGAHQ